MIVNRKARQEAKQLLRLCRVDDLLDENRVREVVRHTLATGRRNCPPILSHFRRLVRLDLARHTATVESATPLPPDLRVAIQADLVRLYGQGLAAEFRDRPSLIAGVRIRVGSDVYDGSVTARLAALENRF